jgi:hypothetical protein
MEYPLQAKVYGGLGILNLETQNTCLLNKWIFKLLNEDGMWQRVLKRKYVKNKCLSQIERRLGDSHFWSGLMEVKNAFLRYGRFKVNSGHQPRFWEDVWTGQQPLTWRFPNLYSLVRKKNVFVAEVLNSTPLNISFRRSLIRERLEEWIRLVTLVLPVSLNNKKDKFTWLLKKDGSFTT